MELNSTQDRLEQENAKLKKALQSIIKQLSEYSILVNIDLTKDKNGNYIPHKTIRLYSLNGDSIGFGEIEVNTQFEEDSLFNTKGYSTFTATIDLNKLIRGNDG